MNLHLIAELGSGRQIHATFGFAAEDAGRTRLDLAVIGDARAPEPWKPGDLQSGPAYHSSAVLVGNLSEMAGLHENIAADFADIVQLKLKRVLSLAGGSTLVRFAVVTGELIAIPEPATMKGSLYAGSLPQKLITDIGVELREALVHQETGRLTKALTPPAELPPLPDPSRVLLTAEQRAEMRKAGLLKSA
jgi:hypothetical protein